MKYLALILSLLLAACGAPTRQDLESLLIRDGDLPAGYTPGQFSDGSFMPGGGMPGADQRVMRSVRPQGGPSSTPSYIAVGVYSDRAAQSRDFDENLPGVTADGQASTEVGERARISGNIVMFLRCTAFAQIQLGNPGEALLYAKRLDARLKGAVC